MLDESTTYSLHSTILYILESLRQISMLFNNTTQGCKQPIKIRLALMTPSRKRERLCSFLLLLIIEEIFNVQNPECRLICSKILVQNVDYYGTERVINIVLYDIPHVLD